MPRRASSWLQCAHRLTIRLVVSLAMLLTLSARVHADAAQEARVLFDAGVGASGAERWDQARDYFKRSLALAQKATTLLNLAIAEVKLGLGHEALATLDTFDRVADPALHADLIGPANELRRLALEAARKQPPNAAVVTETAAPLPVPDSDKADPALSSTIPSVKPEPISPDQHVPPKQISRRLPIGLLIGAAMLTGGSVAGAIGWRERVGKLDDCRTRVPPCTNEDQVKRQRNLGLGIMTVAGAGALGMALAGTLLLLRARPTAQEEPVSVGFTDGVVTVSGRF